jgi:ribosomal protein S18 acetylase RimI-like enzyme
VDHSPTVLELALTIRDLELDDLPDLDWSGGSEHIVAVATALARRDLGEVELVLITLANGASVALGAVDFSKRPGAGELWMLSVHQDLQSLGIGTVLINALEDRIIARGLPHATLGVEHDNPRAAALYRRLGYRENGSALDDWSIGGGRRYVTVCTTMIKDLG